MKNNYKILFTLLFLFFAGIANAQMKADFIPKVTGSKVDFQNYTASNPQSSTLSYRWDFGDGSNFYYTNSTVKFRHTYSQLGTYKVTLIATDTSGTFANDTISDYVDILCIADFSYNSSGNTVTFTDGSAIDTTVIFQSKLDYSWIYSDSNKTKQGINDVHTFPTSGTYTVKHIVYDWSGNSCKDTIEKTINVSTSNPSHDILISYMKVSQTLAFRSTNAVRLYLIQFDSAKQTLTAFDSADVYNDSMYIFKNVSAGNYLVKAALLANDTDYYDYLPTYSDSSLTWSSAYQINHTNQGNSYVYVYLKKGTNPGGSGFIAGYVYQGANKKDGTLENIDVYLTLKDGTPVAFAKTDVEGKYEFKNLAFGEYKLWVEIVGKPSESYDIVLSQNTPSSEEINFDVNKNEIVKRTNASVNRIQNNQLKLYPNPTNDFLTINLEENTNNLEVEVYDINGNLIIKNKMINGEKLDVTNIKTGIYYIQIQTENNSIFRQKFLKD